MVPLAYNIARFSRDFSVELQSLTKVFLFVYIACQAHILTGGKECLRNDSNIAEDCCIESKKT